MINNILILNNCYLKLNEHTQVMRCGFTQVGVESINVIILANN